MSQYRAVLAQPLFRRLLLARTVSNFGNGMSPTATAFAIFALPHGDERMLSIVLTAQAIPMVLLLPIGGVLADRLGRARVIAVTDVILSAVIFTTAGLFSLGLASLVNLVPLYALMGVLTALWYPAYPGLPADLVPEEHLQVANSFISFGSNGAIISGAAVGGWLVSTYGSALAIAVDGATFLLAGALVWALRHTSSKALESEPMLKELHDGWKVFWSYKWVVVVVAAFTFMVMAIRGTEGVIGPLIARDHYGGAVGWSQIIAAEGVGLLAGAALASRWRPQRPMVTGMALTATAAVFMTALALTPPIWVVMLAAASWGVGIETFVIWWFTALQNNIPREAIGRVSAYDAFGSVMFGPIGLALAGPLAAAFTPRPVLLAAAALVILAIGLSLTSKSVRGLLRVEA